MFYIIEEQKKALDKEEIVPAATRYLIERGLLGGMSPSEAQELVSWYNTNAFLRVVRKDDKIAGVCLARRHEKDNWNSYRHIPNGDVLTIRDFAADSIEASVRMYELFLRECLASGCGFPNVIAFNRRGEIKIHPVIGFMQKIFN